MLFYEIAGSEASEEVLLDFAENHEGRETLEECRVVARDFIERYFERHPVDSVDPKNVVIPTGLQRRVVRYAKLISHGRAVVSNDANGNPEGCSPEGPHRVILLLQMLAQGMALADGRMEVTAEDILTIRHVAFSSIPLKRRTLLRALVAAGGTLNAQDVDHALGVKRPTSLDRMEELAAIGLCTFTPGVQKKSRPATIALTSEWEWLLDHTPL
jgi:hypothetical protein